MPRPATALIVDDEPHARTYVRLLLKEAGVTTCWEAGDGASALAMFGQHHPEVVLLDINLRMMTGLQVLQQIKQLNPDVPVVMLSSENAMKTVNEAVRLGANAYILKHTAKEQALAALNEALDDAAEPAGEGSEPDA
jgi:CheY-like chemotaxis protein